MKIINFLNTNYKIIALCLLTIILFKSCTGSLSRRLDDLTVKVDSIKIEIVTKRDLKIEGLKSEKRMIQSTDRKILDVNRQSDIDKEIEKLQK